MILSYHTCVFSIFPYYPILSCFNYLAIWSYLITHVCAVSSHIILSHHTGVFTIRYLSMWSYHIIPVYTVSLNHTNCSRMCLDAICVDPSSVWSWHSLNLHQFAVWRWHSCSILRFWCPCLCPPTTLENNQITHYILPWSIAQYELYT